MAIWCHVKLGDMSGNICTCCDSGRNMLGITLVLGPNYILKCLYHMCRFCDDMAIICVHDGEPIFCSVVFFL